MPDIARVEDALKFINSEPRHVWRDVGQALKLAYGQSGRSLWDQWSEKADEVFDPEEQEKAWRSFGLRDTGKLVTLGTVFKRAREGGWGGAEHEFGDVVAAADGEIIWPHMVGERVDHAHIGNVVRLLEHTKRQLRYNELAARVEMDNGSGFVPIKDIDVLRLHAFAGTKGLRPKKQMFFDHIEVLASRNSYHPVHAYLDGLTWDGVRRVDKFLSVYIGAADTALHRAFSRLFFVGATRRILHPGCQFDYMLVLEGPQGKLKSSAIRALGEPWFTDQLRLGAEAKVTIEQTAGYWLVEVAELAGMDRREVEAIKAQITTREDRARAAFGRFASTVPRQFAMIGTTNDGAYLKDQTGNRRFLPVKVGEVDLGALKRDRDQLWAEALALVRAGELPIMPRDLWAAAAEAQEARLVVDPIAERLRELLGDIQGGRIDKEDIWRALGMPDAGKRSQPAMNSITATMRKLGWTAARQRHPKHKKRRACYEKVVPGMATEWLCLADGEFAAEDEIETMTTA